jgi:hypothetical protein
MRAGGPPANATAPAPTATPATAPARAIAVAKSWTIAIAPAADDETSANIARIIPVSIRVIAGIAGVTTVVSSGVGIAPAKRYRRR